MPTENLDMESITEARRKAFAESIHKVTVEQLKELGEQLFPFLDHPWRETYFNFISENSDATFYHAVTPDRIHVIYCHEKEKGMWFMPGKAKGPLQPKGLRIFKEIVETGA